MFTFKSLTQVPDALREYCIAIDFLEHMGIQYPTEKQIDVIRNYIQQLEVFYDEP